MLPAKRRARIIELLRTEGAASLRDMADALKISLSTARRDVEYLHETGHLQRTHGGAIITVAELKGFELASEIASAIASAEKKAIGQRAAAMIQPGQTVIFDSGTTTGAAAQSARERNIPFTAVTNDLHIGSMLSENPAIHTTVTGGYVRPGSTTLMGAAAAHMLGRLRADIAFIGTHALTEEFLSDTSPELAEIKHTILGAADVVVLLADSSKFFSKAFCTFGRLSDVNLIITDNKLRPELAAKIQVLGVPLEFVSSDSQGKS
ncbi:DeoR/GlpR family DNA-binding transcription regulator [Phyllobacterium endophyticum]|uniref:DeoR/GlpR transcriptional regulator n=1 Tax=Phyllobacterium endophyticum TaxID=1149773 RepID=A0A2P7AR50_9HYPH|nr:DeoR/GlpR family DNA-binding transcription regulator [Phyllobacterium endophyticum]MBB3237292.1 DeoR/GlpR family transcriptional regulator of sugar metabolism [Phyllobacterium endophyticum]PSH56660.1 DeoR/GlpR transcriptional regulator [Phyllobacterium endophyticum]TYR44347.1 DeoR/GlpR transcriptional regulator [Phyllobacterium endophyticum]